MKYYSLKEKKNFERKHFYQNINNSSSLIIHRLIKNLSSLLFTIL